jgi:hypothetical protein
MSYGADERDFHKHIWQIPIPLYNRNDDLHNRLSARGAQLETAIGELEIVPGRHFAAVSMAAVPCSKPRKSVMFIVRQTKTKTAAP